MRFFMFLSILCFSPNVFAISSQITDMQLWQEAQHDVRLMFELSRPTQHKLFTLSSPHRLVIDLKQTKLTTKLSSLPDSIIKKVRSAPRNQTDLRVVLDLKYPVRANSQTLKPINGYGHRLLVNITPLNPITPLEKKEVQKPVSLKLTSPKKIIDKASIPDSTNAVVLSQHSTSFNNDKLIVAIDAGHGGIDPGAVGQNGTYEKDVVLDIAKELVNLLIKEPHIRPVLIRSDDYFLKLRKRIELAREYKADLFISIHADAYADKAANGVSVYMLSQSGASSEAAQWLADKENAADLLDGVSLNDKDDLLASVLLDLSQNSTLEASAYLAQKILKAFSKVNDLHLTKVQHAGFMVLRSPDIPSVLVETGFISNPSEEKKLNNPRYKKRIAYAILEGLQAYLKDHTTAALLAKH